MAADFHLHGRYEIYFFISGNVKYFVEKKSYALKYGDLLVMNSHEIHKPSFLDYSPYERYVIHFDPELPRIFSYNSDDLLSCFENRPVGEQNKIVLRPEQIEELKGLFRKIERIQRESEYASSAKLACFLEILILINKAFRSSGGREEPTAFSKRLAPILEYIDENLDGDLSLSCLEKKFYISGSYLSRLFRKNVGSNLHEYIIYKRISRAKRLLTEGYNANQAALMCGFSDFSNFSRLFKRTVGVSVREYKSRVKNSVN
ncbi:MAG TPA: AraC family transcriptional regulator [Clostridiaceae bacterium]|nr:AraC family transcriptional regulator [Clostridiaceae bacterium]